MGHIKTTYDLSKDLTVITATGKMAADDIFAWSENYYASGEITTLHLWDVTAADLSQITTEDVIEDSRRTAQAAQVRRGGKTAVVASQHTLEFGLSRMSETQHEIDRVPVAYRIFSSLDEAKQWLGV